MTDVSFRVEDAPQRVPTRAPRLGEHSRELLRELGYDDGAVDHLLAEGVVRTAP